MKTAKIPRTDSIKTLAAFWNTHDLTDFEEQMVEVQKRVFERAKMRREKRTHWVRSGKYAVEVEVEVVYPEDDPAEPCLEPQTAKWLDEIARRAKAGDLDYLRKVGKVYQAVET